MNGREVFARYLDLSPLRGRSRGKVRCIFHSPDRHPSLDVDLDRRLFICRACGIAGGMKRFRELVGDIAPIPVTPRSRPQRSPTDEAHAVALREARAQAWAQPGMLELYAASDWVRAQRRLLYRARCAATAAGPTGGAWRVLALAAERERWMVRFETLLEQLAELFHS